MEEFELPEDLTALDDDALQELLDEAVRLFDELNDAEQHTAETIAAMSQLAQAIELIRADKTRRETETAEARAEADRLAAQVHGTESAADDEDSEDSETAEGETSTEEGDPSETGEGTEADTDTEVDTGAEVSEGNDFVPEPIAASGARHDPRDDLRRGGRINVPLSRVRRRAPDPGTNEPEREFAITAAADLPGYSGRDITDLDDLTAAFHRRAGRMPITRAGRAALDDGRPVATIHHRFDAQLEGDGSAPVDVEQALKQLTDRGRTVDSHASMVAAGGWCAPSETRYDLFDVTCSTGEGFIDLPTTGIERGGVRWPISPSFADFIALVPPGGAALGTDLIGGNNTMPWTWTEADDIAATGQPAGPEKLCLRAVCPTFDEERLDCYGVCITAGNLTDDAYPELTQKYIRMAMAAHARTMNARNISLMVAASTPCATGGFLDEAGAASTDLLAAAEWAAIDYRYRFGMCDNEVLEMVLPTWAKAVVRADLSRRNGMMELAVTDDQINDWFDLRGVRVQWVRDWQFAGTNQPGGASPTVLYPSSVNFMLYSAGTFVLGNGMTLDLGAVRDSILNSTNDHTAVWTEECHLVAKFGHESRCYTVGLCAAGRSGIADLAACGTS